MGALSLPDATDIQPGTIVVLDREPWKVLALRVVAGGEIQTSLRSLRTGSQSQRRFAAAERVEIAPVETRQMQYLYAEAGLHHFMDARSFEQMAVDADLLAEALPYMRIGDLVAMASFDGRPAGVQLPPWVELVVTATGPGTEDVSVSNVFKDATLETGITIKVPLFVELDQSVRVDTRTGQFIERVS